MRIVVGLGNPGLKYRQTRHNIGFMVVDVLRRRWNAGNGRKAFGGRLYSAAVASPRQEQCPRRVLMLKPHTYMNDSGRAVRDLIAFHKANAKEDLLVVMDDLALAPGKIRLRSGGSSGGHKGLADVQAALGTMEISRLRIGIGPAPELVEATDYVLGRFDDNELTVIEKAVTLAADAVQEWLFEPLADVMSKYNASDV
ncbi:MAG: aminoacyl-tRNA hydrolase [Planctomycetes bacterium]|nr:aminoacyl-tRNA hydrolase [Planctomycetota bacterium]